MNHRSQQIIRKMAARTQRLTSLLKEVSPKEEITQTVVQRIVQRRESIRRTHYDGIADLECSCRWLRRKKRGSQRPKYKFHRRGTGRLVRS
jgi:hypothetical protein